MTVITTSADLAAFCQRCQGQDFLAVDTEFVRESTYWPQLCLVQVASASEAVAIDVLADGISLEPLLALMNDDTTLKVLHAGRQDIEIFFHLSGRVPNPIFDTQVAAMACGFGDSVSLDALSRRISNRPMDKASRGTDWSRRPMTDRQVQYALDDVLVLRPIYTKLHTQLADQGRLGWLDEEMAILRAPATYAADPAMAWQRLKIRTRSRRQLARLAAVAALREQVAQESDRPKNRILRDDVLQELAAQAPKTLDALSRVRGVGQPVANGKLGGRILKALEGAAALADNELPRPKPRFEPTEGSGPTVELLKVLLKLRCQEFEVANKLVASTTELEQLASGAPDGVRATNGWRADVFGNAAHDLMAGRLALALRDGDLQAIPVPEQKADSQAP